MNPTLDSGAVFAMDPTIACAHLQNSNTKNPDSQCSLSRSRNGNLHQLVLHSRQDLSKDTGAQKSQKGCRLPLGHSWANLRAPGRAPELCPQKPVHRPLMNREISRGAVRQALDSAVSDTCYEEGSLRGLGTRLDRCLDRAPLLSIHRNYLDLQMWHTP
jgi:hypothetical protein